MRVTIEIFPASQMRYDTSGDWIFVDGDLKIAVADQGDWKMETCFAIHELVEALLCKSAAITQQQVDDFDMSYHGEREPGLDPTAPYHEQHRAADIVERFMGMLLKVSLAEQFPETGTK